ncbi:uncharacterized protein LOC132758174 isoform X3 [Ruditapes philippinarum]|uniref:uncharacterized protein LOC132758174 isoform X3 n=1 Tax=Ruditapes philippinarum TaxID=129788 RepID=UPI00295C1C27|nr:uncharacterized protein LOC132758174 isoform X3 [Ruditapes philippinarum]
MTIKYTFVCLSLIILHVSAKEPIESKDGRMVGHDMTTYTNNETVLLPVHGKDENLCKIFSFAVIFLGSAFTVIRYRGRSASHVITTQQRLSLRISGTASPGRIDNNGRPKNSVILQNLKKKDVVNVGFNKDAKNKEHDCRSGLLPKICFLDRAEDACILELDCDSALLPAPFNVFMDFRKMWDRKPQSKFVHVMGQHPTERIIVLDPGCKVISKGDEKVKKIDKWLKKNKSKVVRNGHDKHDVEECYEYYYESEDYLLLDTYLEFGASGGAVVSFTPDGDIALVGVLLQGIPSWYWNEECVKHGYSSKVRIEVACPISNILKSKEWRGNFTKETLFWF